MLDETPKLIWTISEGGTYHHHSSELGSASVEEIICGKWRWEAYSDNEFQSLDMDSWWGISPSLEKAQLSAEKELLRWGRRNESQ